MPLKQARAVVLKGPLVAFLEFSRLADEIGDLLDLGARDLVAELIGALVEGRRR